MRRRSGSSSEASGSSSTSSRGRLHTARANATRCRCPAESVATARSSSASISSSFADAGDLGGAVACGPSRARSRTREQVAAHVEMREEQTFLRHVADAALLGRDEDRALGVEPRRAVDLDRCRARRVAGRSGLSSRLVLPAPDGPKIAGHAAPSVDRDLERERREVEPDVGDAASARAPAAASAAPRRRSRPGRPRSPR